MTSIRSFALLRSCAIVLACLHFSTSVSAQEPSDAYLLLQELQDFPAGIEPTTINQRRNDVYSQFLSLGNIAVEALSLGLSDADVRIRRQAALALSWLGGGYFYDGGVKQSALDIESSLAALERALEDSDSRVRGLSAQAIGSIGESGLSAVPRLIELLHSSEEADRNSAAIGLRGIGPAARDALPDLNEALSDPSSDVQHFARMAIESIGGQ